MHYIFHYITIGVHIVQFWIEVNKYNVMGFFLVKKKPFEYSKVL